MSRHMQTMIKCISNSALATIRLPFTSISSSQAWCHREDRCHRYKRKYTSSLPTVLTCNCPALPINPLTNTTLTSYSVLQVEAPTALALSRWAATTLPIARPSPPPRVRLPKCPLRSPSCTAKRAYWTGSICSTVKRTSSYLSSRAKKSLFLLQLSKTKEIRSSSNHV